MTLLRHIKNHLYKLKRRAILVKQRKSTKEGYVRTLNVSQTRLNQLIPHITDPLLRDQLNEQFKIRMVELLNAVGQYGLLTKEQKVLGRSKIAIPTNYYGSSNNRNKV